jgi:hypothetical protein
VVRKDERRTMMVKRNADRVPITTVRVGNLISIDDLSSNIINVHLD